MTICHTKAYGILVDLLQFMNQQPASVFHKCLAKAKNNTRKGFAGESAKSCAGRCRPDLKSGLKGEVSKQLFVLRK